MNNSWLIIGMLGGAILVLFFGLLIKADWKFDAPLLGLFLVGTAGLAIAILQPESIKYGDMELKKFTEQAEKSKEDAEKASKLAMETMAILLWNQGRWGGMDHKKSEIVLEKILKDLWGEDAGQYKNYMQKKGVYLIPEDDRKNIPETDFPNEIHSPFYDIYLKEADKRN